MLAPGVEQRVAVAGKTLVVAEDQAQGAGGKGVLNVSVCPATGVAEVYFYDHFPLAHTAMSAPVGYGAMMKRTVQAAACCVAGDPQQVTGVRAVLVRQNDVSKPLQLAELEIYATSNEGVNIASTATCYLLPSEGNGFFNANKNTGVTLDFNDGDYSTAFNTGAVSPGMEYYAFCALPEPILLHSIKLVPRGSNADNSENMTLELYAELGADVGEDADLATVRPVGKLWQRLVEHPGASWYAGETFTIPSAVQSGTYPCDERATGEPLLMQYPSIHGKAFAIVVADGSVEVQAAVSFDTCPGDASAYAFDSSFPQGQGQAQTCLPCPSKVTPLPCSLAPMHSSLMFSCSLPLSCSLFLSLVLSLPPCFSDPVLPSASPAMEPACN